MVMIPAALILSLGSLAGSTTAQSPNTTSRETTVTGTVDRIDRSSRTVTVRLGSNMLQTVHADPQITIFDELRVGDVITVRSTESVVVQVRPGAKLTDVQDTTEQARKAGDDQVLQQLKTVVTIDEIDPQGLFVTYRTHDNQKIRRGVQDKKLLEGIRPGDRVEITSTLARAVSIERRR